MRLYFRVDECFDQAYGITESKNAFLSNVIRKLRAKRPQVKDNQEYTIQITEPSTLQLWIRTPGCTFSKAGSCSFCDYWIGKALKHPEKVVETALVPYKGRYQTLIFNTCGSPLDYAELSAAAQEKIWKIVGQMGFSTVIIETHMNTVDVSRLEMLKRCISANLVIEVGLESSSHVTQYALNKQVNLQQLQNTIQLVHGFGMRCCVNIILGSPFLSIPLRMEDAICSVRDALSVGADSCVLFPINLKAYTLVHYLAEHGMYEPVCGWEFLTVLDAFTPAELERLYIAWYQEREQNNLAYTSPIIAPKFCPECRDQAYSALAEYVSAWNGRKDIITHLMHTTCRCRKHFENRYAAEQNAGTDVNLYIQYEKLSTLIEKE